MLKIQEIKDKYPIGCTIKDCFGSEDMKIFNHHLSVSKYHKGIVYVMGHQCIYDSKTGIWAEVINLKTNKMKPIHKFNNGNKATICNICRTIIYTDFTDDVLCKKCKLTKKEENEK